MTQTHFIVLRHGETVWNLEDRYQGQLDSPLTPAGLEQARALAERLCRCRFSALYSSDLGRANDTARIIAERTSQTVRLETGLRERHLGIFQGLAQSEIQEKFPDEYHRFRNRDPDHVLPGGESAAQHSARVVGCFEELARRHKGECIVVVTHGGVLSVIFRHALGIALDAPRTFGRANASWNRLRCERGKWFVETWGDVSHLHEAPGLEDI